MPNYRNYAVQIGHLGSDPEITEAQQGSRRVATFRRGQCQALAR